MGAAIQLFENFYTDIKCAPDMISLDTFKIHEINTLVISRANDGKISSYLSRQCMEFETIL